MTLNGEHSIEAHLQCGICHEILIEPMELVCAHLFCEYCIEQWLREHADCPMCRAAVPRDPEDPDQLSVCTADANRVIDHVVRSLPPVVQEERRAAKRLREEAVEHENAAKRRKLDTQSWTETYQSAVEVIMSLAVVAVLGSLTAIF